MYYCITSILCFGFLSVRPVRSELPDQKWNTCPMHWKVKASPLVTREVPILEIFDLSAHIIE